MTRLQDILHAAARDLADLRLGWALVAGLAVSARTEPRFTRDIDLALAVPGDTGAEQAVTALQRRGYRIHALVEQKVLSRDDRTRPQDRVDLAALLRVATSTDLEKARRAVALIHTRGFQRDRHLARDLELLIGQGA